MFLYVHVYTYVRIYIFDLFKKNYIFFNFAWDLFCQDAENTRLPRIIFIPSYANAKYSCGGLDLWSEGVED